MFVDKVRVLVRAGNGGNGVVSFRHEKFVDRGGPDGGDGGDGGDVIFVADNNLDTLSSFRHLQKLEAEDGQSGSKQKKHGKQGNDVFIKIPVGTVVLNEGELLADLDTKGQASIIARGGRGGFGNAHFKSSRRQSPKVAEKGEPGESFELTLELKLLADVGLVGLPNAGKSTFLSKVSNAKPEIADYPFTTLIPNLGVADIDNSSLLIADIPGLIEGASKGKGLGTEFLRHIERTAVLIHLVDIYSTDIEADYKAILNELATYKIDLSKKPRLIALTKCENIDKELLKEQQLKVKKLTANKKIYTISSATGEGLNELLKAVNREVIKARRVAKQEAPESGGPVVLTLDDTDKWTVTKEETGFRVKGYKIEKFSLRTDFENEHGVRRLKDIMKKMGILHEVVRQGGKSGDKVYVGDTKHQKIKL